jgi:dipeptidase
VIYFIIFKPPGEVEYEYKIKSKRGQRMKYWMIVLTLLFLAGWSSQGYGCTVIAVGKGASADGSVILSHTDCGPDSRIFVVPGRKFKPGEMAPVYWGIQDVDRPLLDDGEILGYIPQATETYRYFHSAYSHINEHQLGIAESTMAQRDELVVIRDKDNKPRQIMTIEQAQIFALQRCKKARDAVKLIGDLMTTYGFLPSSGDGSEVLAIGDTEEAWIFEVFSVGKEWSPDSRKPGAIWAAQRLPADQATVIPNWSIIKEIHIEDTARFMASANYKQEAIDRGWYNPASGKPFIWQEAYAPIPQEYATSRFWLFFTTFAPNAAPWPDRSLKGDSYRGLNQYYQYVEPLSLYPFAIKPEKKISVRDIMAFQRSTFEGTIYDLTSGPQWLVPDGKGGFVKSPLATPFPGSELRKLLRLTNRRPVARHRGHYGMIAQLRSWLPNEIGGLYWVYLDNPYISPYVPIYAGNLSIAAGYNTYDPEKYDEKSTRWAIDFVDNLAYLKFQEAVKDVWAARNPFEEEIFTKQQEIEKEALKLYRKNPQTAQKYLTGYSNGLMNRVVAMYLNLRDTLLVKYTNNRE